jgi:hypothetical protein
MQDKSEACMTYRTIITFNGDMVLANDTTEVEINEKATVRVVFTSLCINDNIAERYVAMKDIVIIGALVS